VHDDVRAIAEGTGVSFGLDVVLNREQHIVAAFGGDLLAMHAKACAAAREVAMRPVRRPFDVVVTTNAGFPLDQKPVPVGEGHVRGIPGGTTRRHDHLRRRVPGRVS
jgi:nickel-dependent lactate racemase